MYEAVKFLSRKRNGENSVRNTIVGSIPLLEPVRAVAVSNITVFEDGSAGVSRIDDVTIQPGNRILLTRQNDENGIWTVGDPIIRPLGPNAMVYVEQGTVYRGRLFIRIDMSNTIMPVAGGGDGGVSMPVYVEGETSETIRGMDIDATSGRLSVGMKDLRIDVPATVMIFSASGTANGTCHFFLQNLPHEVRKAGFTVDTVLWNANTNLGLDVTINIRYFDPYKTTWVALPEGTFTVPTGTSPLRSRRVLFPDMKDHPQGIEGSDSQWYPAFSFENTTVDLPAMLPLQVTIQMRDRSKGLTDFSLPSEVYVLGLRLLYYKEKGTA